MENQNGGKYFPSQVFQGKIADCRGSGLSVTHWCAEHGIKPKTYYNWQKKVFAAMLAQQQSELSDTVPRFAGFRRRGMKNS